MLKLILLLKRRPGISQEEFKTYYEEKHAPLGISLMPRANRYLRRYLGAESPEGEEPPYDVLTEVWFESRADYEQTIADMVRSGAVARLQEDEARLFEHTRTRMIVLDECETDCPINRAPPL